jgi:hypothetical protein
VNVERLLRDVVAITDGWRGATWGRARMALAICRNYDRRHAPQGFRMRNLFELLTQFEPRFKAVGDDWSARDNADPEWRLLNIQANWFQDLFNFDLAAAQMDSTPVATVEGEIGFSAYNALGWRKIVEHRHQTATLAEWHRTHGRHPIYANGATVQIRTRAAIEQAREAAAELVAR